MLEAFLVVLKAYLLSNAAEISPIATAIARQTIKEITSANAIELLEK